MGAFHRLGPEFALNTTTAGAQAEVALTTTRGGGFVAVWQSDGQDGNSLGIYGQVLRPDGRLSGPELRFNATTAGTQMLPDVAEVDRGYAVVWQSLSPGQENWAEGGGAPFTGQFGVFMHQSSIPAGSDRQVNTWAPQSQQFPSIADLTHGGHVVTWSSDGQDGSAYGVYGQIFDDLGRKAGAEFQINTTTADYQHVSSVTGLADGRFVVAWQSRGQDGSDYGAVLRVFEADGTPAGPERPVNVATTGFQGQPEIAALAGGGFVATWQSAGQDGSGNGVYARLFDANGAAVGGELAVNQTTAGDQDLPAVAATPDGGFIVAWQSQSPGGDGLDVMARRFNSSGHAVTAETRVNVQAADSQGRPDIAVNRDGSFLIAWEEWGRDGDASGIFAGRFGPSLFPPVHAVGSDDRMAGSGLPDYIFAGRGNNSVTGGKGRDTILGGGGRDQLAGGAQADTVKGGRGNDSIQGGNGADRLNGDAGADNLEGGRGNDALRGGGGGDWIEGGAGDDTVAGGGGGDTFAFFVGDGADRILDFADDVDMVHLDAGLWRDSHGDLGARQVVRSFAGKTADGDVVLDFGDGQSLTFDGLTRTRALIDDLFIEA